MSRFQALGAALKQGDLISAALAGFLTMPEKDQILLIQRGKTFALERLAPKELAPVEAAIVAQIESVVGKHQQSPKGTRKKAKTGT